MENRLAKELSPYLRQHAGNLVDWYPWGPEALERARRENRPILLSIGYSACHWCHVMAAESFSDPDTAALMNRLFVNIKVDREERPDLDLIYQQAHQLLTGRAGGWPLTVFLTPEQVPFFAGTYFPPRPRFGRPGFVQVLERVTAAYRGQSQALTAQTDAIKEALAHLEDAAPSPGSLHDAPIRDALAHFRKEFDPLHGGFGDAPKFPRPPQLEFLWASGDPVAREQVLFTLRRMAEGGIFDQLAGGFFRYSVDEAWAIPHFEKMLYDQGPLVGLYADAWAATGEELFHRVVERTISWLVEDMRSGDGLFFSSLDADLGHREGAHYLWNREEVKEILKDDEYAVASASFGLDRPANFAESTWHLGCGAPLEETAERLGLTPAEAQRILEAGRRKLLAARKLRPAPHRDEKLLAGWNALAIAGLARAARRLGRADWAELAQLTAEALRGHLWRNGRLLSCGAVGKAAQTAFLDDHAYLLQALLELLQTDFRKIDLGWAVELAEEMVERFYDSQRGGFWFTAGDQERLIMRPKPGEDLACASGNAAAIQAFGRLYRLTGVRRYQQIAEQSLRFFFDRLQAFPMAFPGLLQGLVEQLYPPKLVVLRGLPDRLTQWKTAAWKTAPADVIMICPPAGVELPPPLERPWREEPVAYVCPGEKCLPPINRLPALLEALADR